VHDTYKLWETEVYNSYFPAVSFFFTFKPLFDLLPAKSFEYLVGYISSTELVQELRNTGNKRFLVEQIVASLDEAYENKKENKNQPEEIQGE
jgi:hypothetical protein